MIIHNVTRIPTAALLPVLRAAKTAVGSVPTKVAVLIKWGGSVHGFAKDYCAVRRSLMGLRPSKKSPGVNLSGFGRTDYVPCQGFIILYIPYGWDPLSTAKHFFSTTCHEFKHVKDFAHGKWFGDYNRNWKNRPHEKRAIRTAKCIMSKFEQGKRPDWQDAVINLGIALEEMQKSKIQSRIGKLIEEIMKLGYEPRLRMERESDDAYSSRLLGQKGRIVSERFSETINTLCTRRH